MNLICETCGKPLTSLDVVNHRSDCESCRNNPVDDPYRVFHYGQQVILKFPETTLDGQTTYPPGAIGQVFDSHVVHGGYGYSVSIGDTSDRPRGYILVRADRLKA